MSLIALILTLVVVGIVLWAINTFIPLDPKVKSILNIVVIVFLILWLLKALGLWEAMSHVRV